jgi:hypothetical protein
MNQQEAFEKLTGRGDERELRDRRDKWKEDRRFETRRCEKLKIRKLMIRCFLNTAYVGNSAAGVNERCELQFFRRYCAGFSSEKKIGVGVRS